MQNLYLEVMVVEVVGMEAADKLGEEEGTHE